MGIHLRVKGRQYKSSYYDNRCYQGQSWEKQSVWLTQPEPLASHMQYSQNFKYILLNKKWSWFKNIMWLLSALVWSRSGTPKMPRFWIEPEHFSSTIQMPPFDAPLLINNFSGLEEITNI